MSHEMKSCVDQYVSGEKWSFWKTLLAGAGCALVCATFETGVGAVGCGLCILAVVGDGIRDADKASFQKCVDDRGFKCRGLKGDPNRGLGGGGGGGGAEGGVVAGSPGGDPYGLGATQDFLNWLSWIYPEGEDHLA